MTRTTKALAVAGLLALALSGCSLTTATATTDTREQKLPDGRTVVCVIAGATSGSPSISCDWENAQ